MTTYRAAYWTDGHGKVCLTSEEQQHLRANELIAAAKQLAEATSLEIGNGRIEIGDYTE